MKFINKIRSFSRKAKIAAGMVVLAAAVAVPMVKAEYYPARPAYDYNKPCNPNDNDPYDRCGSLDGPVFNSFIHTPSYGDERAFFDGRRSDMPTNTNADDITNVNKGSKEVVLRVYVHNNANQSTNANGKGVAHNAKVRVALPTATEQVLRARAYISANNAALVEDTADLIGTEKFSVSYVPGSAKLLRGTSQYALSDSIVTSGAQIGNNVMNGELPGCFDYAALVELKVKVNVQENPKLQLVKEVKIKGQEGWKKEVFTKPGTEVQWRLGTKNISNSTLTQVNLRDVMPPHVKLVPGSVRIIDANQDTVQKDDPLFGGGFGMGTYPSGGIRYIIFNTITKDDFSSCEVRVRNQAFAKSDQTPKEEKDTSDVVIKKEKCNPPVTPKYACDLLKAQVVDQKKREVKFTANASASNGASIERYRFTFGDGSDLTTDQNMVTHTYAKDGQYAAKVAVEVRVDGAIQIAESANCQAVLTFESQPPETPPTPNVPGSPTSLPETGPGEVILAFIAVTLASSVTYFAIVRKLAGLA